MMNTKKIEFRELCTEHNYSILQDYSSHNQKIEISCNNCKEKRLLLLKSFIKNPDCKSCKKNKIKNSKKKEKITEMNINIRRKAKRIGFKINEWFDSQPKEVTVYCRDCNHEYIRSLNSLRNGLVCFNCKKGNTSNSLKSFEEIDIPFIIDIITKNKKINSLSKLEKKVIRTINKNLTKENKSNLKYNSKTKTYNNDDISIYFNNINFKKKFLLGNLLQKINITPQFNNIGSKRNYTIKELEKQYGLNIIVNKILKKYSLDLENLSHFQVLDLYNNICFYNFHIKLNNKNIDNPISLINLKNYKNPTSIRTEIKDSTLKISFNNGIKFVLKLQQAKSKETLNSIQNLFQESWTFSL